MGIDLLKSRSDKNDRNIWYKGEYVNNMKLVQNATAQGVFYSTDKVSMTRQTVAVGSVKKTLTTVTIETNDNVEAMTVDDYVVYDGDLWVVESIVANDDNEAKEFSNRPSYVTEIRLRR